MTDFLDTNILVYAYDTHVPAKQNIVRQILESAILEETAAISAQILSEFFVVVTRRIALPLTPTEAGEAISLFRALPVADIDAVLVESAVDIHQRHALSFWDSLVVAAACRLGCARLLTEDMQAGQRINGLLVVNPFVQAGKV